MIFLVLVAVPITFEFILFSGPTIRLLYGATYAPAAGATRLVVASECLGFFTILGVTTLVAQNRNVWYPLATLGGVVVNVALNVFVIPRYSYNGAAVDTLFTEVVVFALIWVPILRTSGRGPLPLGVIVKALGAGALSALLGVLLAVVAPWPVAATASALAYVAIVQFAGVAGAGGLSGLVREES
jgi:O-antigen/teichoic acid export membrane protein